MRKNIGFTLLELMIVLVIMGILSAICIPIYSGHLVRARRLSAEVSIVQLANALEKYFLLNNTYQNATLNTFHFPEMIVDNQYHLQIVSATDSQFVIKASPINNQAEKDVICGDLLLDSTGNKGITGKGSIVECWT